MVFFCFLDFFLKIFLFCFCFCLVQSGWLTKEGGGFKSWKKRWFWLKDGCLHYSKTKNGKDLGVIRLENATHIKPDTAARPKKKNVFEIPTPDRTYYLCADTQEDRDEWVALCQAAKKVQKTLQKEKKKLSKKKNCCDYFYSSLFFLGRGGKVQSVVQELFGRRRRRQGQGLEQQGRARGRG